ncbi:MAG: alpha/beta fold hydrolase [Acidobacteria bacterium]|nr:alpha/beta fold hydrolase [Acidobacteriota bacterium]
MSTQANPVTAASGAADGAPQLPAWLREMYPFHTASLPVDGGRMSYVDEGAPDAPPIMLLHGNPTWSFLYRGIISKLSARYRVIAPDHVGFGLSDKPSDPGWYTLERHIANFTTLIESLQLRKVTLVLHDWGGPIGLGYAVAHPENVARLVLMNTWASVPHSPDPPELHWGLRLSRGSLGPFTVQRLNLFVELAMRTAVARKLTPREFDAYRFPFPDAASRAGVLAFPRMIPLRPGDAAWKTMSAIESGLAKVTAPSDILWGKRDPVLSGLYAYLLRDRLKNAREPVFLDKASHFVPEDAPSAIAERILTERKAAVALKILT